MLEKCDFTCKLPVWSGRVPERCRRQQRSCYEYSRRDLGSVSPGKPRKRKQAAQKKIAACSRWLQVTSCWQLPRYEALLASGLARLRKKPLLRGPITNIYRALRSFLTLPLLAQGTFSLRPLLWSTVNDERPSVAMLGVQLVFPFRDGSW